MGLYYLAVLLVMVVLGEGVPVLDVDEQNDVTGARGAHEVDPDLDSAKSRDVALHREKNLAAFLARLGGGVLELEAYYVFYHYKKPCLSCQVAYNSIIPLSARKINSIRENYPAVRNCYKIYIDF